VIRQHQHLIQPEEICKFYSVSHHQIQQIDDEMYSLKGLYLPSWWKNSFLSWQKRFITKTPWQWFFSYISWIKFTTSHHTHQDLFQYYVITSHNYCQQIYHSASGWSVLPTFCNQLFLSRILLTNVHKTMFTW